MLILIRKISQSKILYIIFFNSLILGTVCIWGAINYLTNFNSPSENFIEKYSIGWKIALGSIIAPFIETFINQWLVYKLLSRYTSNNNLIIIISAVFFGFLHWYSIGYIIATFLIGIFLMVAFINWEGAGISKYMMTVIIHMIHNTLMLILSSITK